MFCTITLAINYGEYQRVAIVTGCDGLTQNMCILAYVIKSSTGCSLPTVNIWGKNLSLLLLKQ